jgi:nucleoside-diphosphate-sugar epimerase
MRDFFLGGTHFIGPPLVRRLVALGHEILVFHRGRTQAALPPGVRHITSDLRRAGLEYDRRKRLLVCRKVVNLPYRYLGADDPAGPNYTGQPAVDSHDESLGVVC